MTLLAMQASPTAVASPPAGLSPRKPPEAAGPAQARSEPEPAVEEAAEEAAEEAPAPAEVSLPKLFH